MIIGKLAKVPMPPDASIRIIGGDPSELLRVASHLHILKYVPLNFGHPLISSLHRTPGNQL